MTNYAPLPSNLDNVLTSKRTASSLTADQLRDFADLAQRYRNAALARSVGTSVTKEYFSKEARQRFWDYYNTAIGRSKRC